MEKPATLWSVPVAVEDIPDDGLHVSIEAPAEARADIAKLANLRELPALSAHFDLVRQGAGVRVSGRVQASVGQTCVVTLEPIENRIDEPVEVMFSPAAGTENADGADDPPEPLVDGQIDLGALATEFLLLAIDPYPRKAGAEFTAPQGEEACEKPFAALEALKKRLGGSPG